MDKGRFVPGSILAERYRIIGFLGQGGMGEVYRADDLKLGQPVALKFLPDALASNPSRLEQFHGEVRLARQVSHPNVCRVYDIGEADGQHFLSMEFVDGEDLASLLRRIGRLPGDKATQLARQLCAGLAAAHETGVLHRDLKPANIMIDGRGRARITDFGLAAIAGDVQGADVRAGTPNYMSPEQLSAREVTLRSDLYSLGLVLFEMFTGKAAFKSAESIAGLVRIREESAPRSPSNVLEGIDPAVERAILRCLEKDPRQRPSSALAVAAALPGGDPLAAALAAGETPSPEMVAAADVEGGLKAPVAWVCLAAVALGLVVAVFLGHPLYLVNQVPLAKPPEVLADRARDVVLRLGHTAPAKDSAFGFEEINDYLAYVRDHDQSPDRWKALASGRPAALSFWYRQSPDYLVAHGPFSVVYPGEPAPLTPGMATVRLDTGGRLIGFDAVPPEEDPPAASDPEPGWSVLFSEAGLAMSRFTPVSPSRVPPVFCDRRAAWEGRLPEQPQVPVRVEAGAYRGRIVSFGLVGPWTRSGLPAPPATGPGGKLAGDLNLALLIVAVCAGVFLARRNLRLGRGDRSGAFKIAFYFVGVHLIVWALWVDHVPDLAKEWQIFSVDTGWTLFNAAMLWLFYLGLEPYVRRQWPNTIISWNRVLAGRFRDPLVGRDLLIGSVLGATVVTVINVTDRLPAWLGRPPVGPRVGNLANLVGLRRCLGEPLDVHVHGLVDVMELLFILLLIRALLRKEWIAAGAFTLLMTLTLTAGGEYPFIVVPLTILAVGAFTVVLMRFGLVAATVGSTWVSLVQRMPVTANLTTWYATSTLLALAVLAGVAIYGFRTTLAGRPALRLVAEEALLG